MIYKLFVPLQAVGANLVYFDLWHVARSGHRLRIKSIVPVVSGATAVSGVVSVDLFLTRTTAIGTGGTAATSEGTSLTAMTFSGLDTTQPINLGALSARLTPSGGATAGAVLSWRSVFTEETNGGTYNQVTDMARGLYNGMPDLIVPGGSGIRVVQGSVASVGNIGFDIFFDFEHNR